MKQSNGQVRVVEHMVEAGESPDAFTYNALISSVARGGLWSKALGYLTKLPTNLISLKVSIK